MANIYFCGHGAWATTGASTGFTHLPPGTTLRVYTPVGRFLSIDQATAILRKDQGALIPDQTFSQYQSATDLTLSPCPEHKFQFMLAALTGGVRAEMVEQDRTLGQLATEFAGNDLHWLACRIRFGGLDTTEGGYNDDV